MDLAKTLLRTMARAFYTTEHILIVDALCVHSTLTDSDLAHILGMQTKALRRLCGKLKEDGMISVHSRGERKEGVPPIWGSQGPNGQPKERLFYRDWYYLEFHRAIDTIKYRLWKLSRHIESQGAPTTERKDLICSRCKSSYTELEVIDNIGDEGFYCHRCGHLLDTQEEASGPAENESMKRMNDQLGKIVALMRHIDSTSVPENDFDTALSYALPINRPDTHQGTKYEPVEDRSKPTLASSKGLALAPEKISVSVGNDSAVAAEDAAAAKERKDREAKQNMLPEWISRSTINGAITAVGAKEDKERQERARHLGDGLGSGETLAEAEAEEKKGRDGSVGEDAVMDDYWKELKAEQERERRAEIDEEDEEEDEDDEFEDVDVGTGLSSQDKEKGLVNGNGSAVSKLPGATPSTGAQSSNATDDEEVDGRGAKRVRIDDRVSAPHVNGTASVKVEEKFAAAAAESDEDEGDLEFEDV